MECAFCYKTEGEVQLFEGVYNQEMVKICGSCAEYENIPIIRRPSSTQIEKSKEVNYSVRGRMERLSGMNKIRPLREDTSLLHSKLRVQPAKQSHPEVLDNYYWTVNMGRRRKKLSILQLSQVTGIPRSTIEEIEKGIIPKDFKEVFRKLEGYFGERLLKQQEHESKVRFVRKVEVEEDILDTVRRKMRGEITEGDFVESPRITDKSHGPEELKGDEKKRKEKKERAESIKSGTFDFSDRKRLESVTLNELAQIKKERERREKERMEEEQRKEMLGDDVELDE